MNENRRILLLALGIIAIVASDPPVAARLGQPHNVCSIAGDLAVSVFDSLVRSTLPLSDDQLETERTDEVLVASQAITDSPVIDARSTEWDLDPSPRPAVSEIEIVSSSAEVIQSACAGSSRPLRILRVEAVMQVQGREFNS